MTREEAIKKMQAVKVYMTAGNPIWSVTEMGEVFDMAIEALQSPTAAECANVHATDVVEVVRCQNCRHNLYPNTPNPFCTKAERVCGWNCFCSEGERRV